MLADNVVVPEIINLNFHETRRCEMLEPIFLCFFFVKFKNGKNNKNVRKQWIGDMGDGSHQRFRNQ